MITQFYIDENEIQSDDKSVANITLAFSDGASVSLILTRIQQNTYEADLTQGVIDKLYSGLNFEIKTNN